MAQPSGFIDFEKPDHVYKLKKALYGLKQAPKAWYDRLKAFLIKHEYKMGMVDNTLFTKKKSSNLIIVQIYVDDIIFGLTCHDMCDEFAKIMHDEFEMSMMGELNLFLRLQIKQMKDGIFFNQSKYIKEMLKKFSLEDSKPMKTPMSSNTKLTKDDECESVDSTKYRGMIGSLLYLTASRLDIMFSVCLCARFQEAPKTSHLEAKQTALAISTTEAEYISTRKACQQAIWMKQALIDYDDVIVGIKRLLNDLRVTAAQEFDLLKWDQQVVSELVALRNFARRYRSRFCTHDDRLCTIGSHNERCNLTKTTFVEGKEQVTPITSAKDKAQRRLEDAKLLLEAVEKRFGENATTKKTQRNLLMHQYENFTASSSEMLDQTFDRLQKLLLRSLSPEWNTHAVVWRNKAELETMRMDDLYNNLKVCEPEVKGMSNSSLSTQNMDFVSSSNNITSSSNEAVNAAHGVITASTQVNIAYSTNINNLSDAVICSFFASQPNSPQLTHEDLQQIHLGDIEEMDLRCPKWSATTAIRVDILLGSEKLQEIKTTRTRKAQEGVSDQADEGPNYALMAYSSSSFDSDISNGSTCSKSCLETVKLLKSQYDQLLKYFKKSELMVLGEITIGELRKKLEIVPREKDNIQFNVDKFENASKSLNKLIESQIVHNCKKGLGYNAVPPPYIGNFMPPTPDLSFTGLDEFVNKPVVENKKSDKEVSKVVSKNDDASIIEEWVSDDEEEDASQPKIKKKTVKPSIAKIKFVKPKQQEKTARKTVKQVDCYYHKKQFQNQRMVKPVWNNAQRVNHQNFAKKTHPYAKKNSVPRAGNPQMDLQDQGVIDSGCSRHMTGNMSYLTNYKEIDRGYVSFGGNPKGGKITGKVTKDETSGILKSFIIGIENLVDHKVKDKTSDTLKSVLTGIENLVDHKVKVIRCDNGTEFKNREINQFCEKKEVVNTTCFVQNRVLVVKPHNKTPYELFHGRTPTLSFIRPFRCPVTILNTIDHLGKFDGKADEGFFVGYSLNSKTFRVFNSRTRIVEENLHIRFSESTPNVVGSGPDWLFDIDALTRTINYEPIVADPKSPHDDGSKPSSDDEKKVNEDPRIESESKDQVKDDIVNSTNNVNIVSSIVNVVGIEVNVVDGKTSIELPVDLNMSALEDYNIFNLSSDNQDDGAEADMNNLDTTIQFSPNPATRIHKDHPLDQEEPKKTLVELPNGKRAIGTKWVFKNKKDERGIVIRNKVRLVAQGYIQEDGIDYDEVFATLVAQGYTQEEWIDYDEVFAPVARIEAIILFLAYASFKDFVVYQMDVKSAFSMERNCRRKVWYVKPLRIGFKDPNFPDRVYKVEKAMYGLHQAPRAWYETLSTYLLDNEFPRGKIDKTLFIKMYKGDILLVQVYVDDIIFGSTKKELYNAFEKLMHKKFQMSSIGELTFFLGLQVQQKKDGIFISQDKYVAKILKKFGFIKVKTASTPMETQKPLLKDKDGEEVDVNMYRSMIGSLMCLTSSRPDIMFVVCACARYQVNLKVSHLHAMKRIFRYLKGQPKLGLWYPKDSFFDLVAYTNSDYAGASLDRKSTTGGCQFLGCRLISWQCKKQTVVANSTTEAEYVAASSCCGQVLWIQNQLLDYGYNFMHTKIFIDNNRKAKKSVRLMMENLFGMELELILVPQPSGPTYIVVDEAIHKELGDSLVRAATTTSSLEAEQDSGNITKSRSKATPNEAGSQETSSCSGPRRQETMRDTIAQTRFVNVSKHSNDPLLARGNTLRSGEDSLKLKELMELCTNLQQRVLDLEKTKTTQAEEIL
ncbi:putative ribonuclease H-like domain-containing protein [Tanacetum coccineum]|uniref:Ribonuclease H-like domain-containing protein n=1 Tax=Tanacetum coccineum TaxID=301880 RepID=A0ABQ5C2D5_9ASTR